MFVSRSLLLLFIFTTLSSVANSATTETRKINIRINDNWNDVEQRADGSMYISSSDLELTEDRGQQIVGLRFTNVGIPAGATVTRAYVQFTTDERNSQTTNLQIHGQAIANAPRFTDNNFDLSERRLTRASAAWSPPAWQTVGESGNRQRTPELKALLNEIIGLNNWQQGNAIVLLISGSGERTAESHNGSRDQAPLLSIEYQVTVDDNDGDDGDDSGNEQRTLSVQISDNNDDVEERANGSMYNTSSDLELTTDGNEQTVGLRFRNINIPRDSSIVSAYLQFTVDETSSESTSLTIRGEATGNANAFSTSNFDVSSRNRTQARVNWSPAPWTQVGAAGSDQRTPNLAAIIEEVIGRNDWRSGNNLALIIDGSGKRTAESHNGSPSAAPRLVINYLGDGEGDDDDDIPDDGNDGVKIAFIGDTGTGGNFQRVLNLIKNENAKLTVVAGDTSYSSSRDDNWHAMVRNTLGTSDAALIAAGNHDYDDSNFSDVRRYGESRLADDRDVSCSGAYAEKMTCRFKNIYLVMSAIGSSGSRSGHESFIETSLANAPSDAWRICAWHKNQRDMQAGGKGDEVGWTAYETCRRYGAIISTGHEHSYSRTHLLSDMSDKRVVDSDANFTLTEGRTFAFVSGLGGIGIRDQERSGNWWAKIYTSTQGARYGALFGTFYKDRAEFYFKNINGQIIDRFTVRKGY